MHVYFNPFPATFFNIYRLSFKKIFFKCSLFSKKRKQHYSIDIFFRVHAFAIIIKYIIVKILHKTSLFIRFYISFKHFLSKLISLISQIISCRKKSFLLYLVLRIKISRQIVFGSIFALTLAKAHCVARPALNTSHPSIHPSILHLIV